MKLFKEIFLITVLLFLSVQVEAKKECKTQLAKLDNIQKLQRQGHSLKQSESLRKREDTARKKWWQCEHSSTAKKKVKKTKTKNKKKSIKTKSTARVKASKRRMFNTTEPIVIKSKYQGDKRLAWLKFYQQPKNCLKPKNIQAFALCSENKREQRLDFEKQY